MGSSPLLVIGRFVLAHRSPNETGEPMTECSEFSGAEETSGGAEGNSNGDPADPTGLDGIGRHRVSLGATRPFLPIGVPMDVQRHQASCESLKIPRTQLPSADDSDTFMPCAHGHPTK